MPRIIVSLAFALFLANLAGCTPPDHGVAGPAAAQEGRAQAEAAPAVARSPASIDSDQSGESGGNRSAGISSSVLTGSRAAVGGMTLGAPQADLSEVNAAIDRVHRANQALLNKGAPATPPPAAPAPQAGLPPAQVKLTGDTIVPTAPELAADVINGIRRVHADQTGCTRIDNIDTKAASAAGPFNKNAQGKLVSGTIVERWSVSGCGKTAAYLVTMAVQPDSTVKFAITGA